MKTSTAHSCSMTRRTALQTMAVAAATGAISQLHAQPPIPAPLAGQHGKPSLHVYPDYGWLRGFSVVPSWGARIEEAWWFYDGARFREEVALARQAHANCIRLWIEFTA